MRSHYPEEGVCFWCGMLTIALSDNRKIYVLNGRVMRRPIECSWGKK